MIEDQELRQLFRVESEEHLDQLEAGLMQLERSPQEGETLQPQLLREAHSLKGAARMLGLSEIELLSHHLEERFRSAREEGSTEIDVWVSQQLTLVDQLKQLCRDAVEGESTESERVGTEASQSEAALEIGSREQWAGVLPPPVSSPKPKTLPVEEEQAAAVETPLDSLVTTDESRSVVEGEDSTLMLEAGAIARTRDYRIDTIRVESYKLDSLMNQVGELLVVDTGVNPHLFAASRRGGVIEDAAASPMV